MDPLQSPSIDPGRFGRFAVELKFSLGRPLAEQVLAWARDRMPADPHGRGAHQDAYSITTLYLDTPRFDVLRRSGSYGRGKYRIRRYGTTPAIFLERKMKSQGLVCKRRSHIEPAEMTVLDHPDMAPGWAGYWFHRRILARGLRPVCQISYLRNARMAMSAEGPIRLTVDQALRATPVDGFAFDTWSQPAAINPEGAVLELKYRGAVPELFRALMAEHGLAPSQSSKYRGAGRALGLGPFCLAWDAGRPAVAPGDAACLSF